MMAQSSDGPGASPRAFTPAVARQLADALRAQQSGSPGASAALESAVRAAAEDARARAMHPEQLVVAMKAVLAMVGPGGPERDADRARGDLLQRMLAAYFADPHG